MKYLSSALIPQSIPSYMKIASDGDVVFWYDDNSHLRITPQRRAFLQPIARQVILYGSVLTKYATLTVDRRDLKCDGPTLANCLNAAKKFVDTNISEHAAMIRETPLREAGIRDFYLARQLLNTPFIAEFNGK